MGTTLRRIILLALWLPLPAWAQDAVLPEGCEPAVLAWLKPLEMTKPVTSEWTLRDVGIERNQLRLTLQGPGGQKLEATLGYPDVLQCPNTTQPGVCKALQVALAQQPRAPSPWLVVQPAGAGRVEIERPGQQFPPRDTTRPARWLLLAVWLALLGGLIQALRRSSANRWCWPLTVTAIGAAVRSGLAPRGLQHEMFHAGESLAFLHGTSHFANGEAVPALVNGVNALAHAGDATLYAVTFCAAIAATSALVWFAWELTADRRVALLAGLLLALAPAPIHFAASEEFAMVGVTLALLSWAAWLTWLKRPTRRMLLVATSAGVLAMQTRPEFALLPLMHLTLTAAVLPPRDSSAVLRRRELWLALGLAALACWHVPLDVHARGGFPGFSPLAVQQIVPRLIWLDPQLAIWPMLFFPIITLVFGLWRATGRVLWLAGWALGLAVLLLSLYVAAGAFAWRMQLLPVALSCVLAAAFVGYLPGPLAWPPALALVIVAVVQLFAAKPAITQPSQTELQYRFELAHVADLPPHAQIVALLSAQIDHPPRLGGLQPGETRIFHDAVDLAHLPPPAPNLVFLQSAACWVRWPADSRDLTGLHPVCQAIHDRYRLETIAEMDLPPTREPPLAWAPPPRPQGYPIGFYRLLPR